jgi:hypothetical protein
MAARIAQEHPSLPRLRFLHDMVVEMRDEIGVWPHCEHFNQTPLGEPGGIRPLDPESVSRLMEMFGNLLPVAAYLCVPQTILLARRME